MLWNPFRRAHVPERGEVARRVHSAWLSDALASGRAYPRIPLRRVDEGGFSVLMGTSYGSQLSEAWWVMTLDQVNTVPGSASAGRPGT
ncbi:MAG: hypothetical protein IT435_19200 [Phycisphaerales bacterium]|nr:hypothetical protein [Phycisphaerales bacterium]